MTVDAASASPEPVARTAGLQPTSEQTSAARPRLMSLDVLRGVAILLVLGHHLRPCPTGEPAILRAACDLLNRGGWSGVDLFFVLSGFLVSGLIFTEYLKFGNFKPLRFLIRRGFKIYPAFYALILFTLFFCQFWITWETLLGELFFLQNYLGAIWGHTWSLAVEEHFYILLCGYLAWLGRGGDARAAFRRLPMAFLAVATGALGGRLYACWDGAPPYATHLATHYRLDSLFWGVVLSYALHFHPERLREGIHSRWTIILAVSMALVAPVFLINDSDDSFYINTFGFTALYLGSGGILMVLYYQGEAFRRSLIGRLITPSLSRIGYYSYSIYLWHMAALRGVELIADAATHRIPHVVYACASILAACGLGILMARIVEIPFLRLRDRHFPTRSSGAL